MSRGGSLEMRAIPEQKDGIGMKRDFENALNNDKEPGNCFRKINIFAQCL